MNHAEGPVSIAYVNGSHMALKEARIPVLDRGFLFGDSVYEVIPVYAGRCYRLMRHIERLQNSMTGIGLPNPHSAITWTTLIEDLVARNGGGDISVYLQVTRGVQPRRDHRLPESPRPNVVAFCQTRTIPDPALFEDGITAITMADTRWQYCSIKSTALLANVLLADNARAQGAAEALLTRDGQVLEGSSSNVFVVLEGCITTPTLRDTILPGITRGAILELAHQHNLAHAAVETLSTQQVAAAEEIWITSSTREIYPVTQLDGTMVGTGRPGPIWTHMSALLHSDVGAQIS